MRITLLALILVLSSCTTRDDVVIGDYPLVTTINELSEYYDLKIDRSGKYESTSITTYLDGASELNYAYELLESDEYDPLFYSITVERENSVKGAKETYGIGKGAFSFVGSSFDQGIVEIDSIPLPGDDSFYALRTYEDEPNGMYFIVRKDKCIYTMILSGLYTPDHSLLTEILLPKIEHLEEFEIID